MKQIDNNKTTRSLLFMTSRYKYAGRIGRSLLFINFPLLNFSSWKDLITKGGALFAIKTKPNRKKAIWNIIFQDGSKIFENLPEKKDT